MYDAVMHEHYHMNRLNQHNWLEIVVPMSRGKAVGDYHVTSCVALAFLKADGDNMHKLMSVYPYVCMDAFCYYNWNVPCDAAPHYIIRALDNIYVRIGVSASFQKQYDYFHKYLMPAFGDTPELVEEIKLRIRLGSDAYWKQAKDKE